MCFGSKDNANDPAPKPAQIPQYQQQPTTSSLPTSKPPLAKTNHNNNMAEDYAPPQGPPPSHSTRAANTGSGSEEYAPPPGPPPSSQTYAPPAGPPPSHHHPTTNAISSSGLDYAPPPGPPPPLSSSEKTKNNPFFFNNDDSNKATSSSSAIPPPPQDWETAVPDTSLLPPPPNYFSGFDRSPTNNATEAEADAGERWCADFPLYAPMAPDPAALDAAEQGNITVFAPPFFGGALSQIAPGVWRVQSQPGTRDTCLATYPPLWSARAHSPLVSGSGPGGRRSKTIYYEVRILDQGSRRGGGEVSLALGFAAPPYPAFRLPGWHRASLAVHGDDGHRYVNDRWGGRSFADPPFRRGETVGLGMAFAPGAAGLGTRVEVFLTRGGREAGRWDLHEETDLAEDLPVAGLEGTRDLCAAVGLFESVAFEIVFRRDLWAWKGWL